MVPNSACGFAIRIQGKKPFNSEKNLFAAIVQLMQSIWLLACSINAPQSTVNVLRAGQLHDAPEWGVCVCV